MLNGQWVAGSPNPYLDGEIPWDLISVNPIGGRIYGLSPAEVIRFLQDAADNFLMLFTDAGDLAIRGPLLVGQAFGGDFEQLRMRRTNDVIKCRQVDAVKPIPVELGALTFAANELARRKSSMREASGATNPIQAIQSKGGTTATEVTELTRAASMRVQSMVELIERDNYPSIARKMHSRIRQFAAPEILARLQGDIFKVKLEDIDIDADIRFVGSSVGGSTFSINQTYSQVANVLGTIPLATVRAFPDVFTRWFRDGLKITDAENIVSRAIELANQQDEQAAAAAAAGTDGPPSSTAKGGNAAREMKMNPGTAAGAAEQSGGEIA